MLIDDKFRDQSQNPLLVRQGELEAYRSAIRLATFHAFSIRRKLFEGAHVEDGPLILSFAADGDDLDEVYRDAAPFPSDTADMAVFDRRDLDGYGIDQMQQRLVDIRAQSLHP